MGNATFKCESKRVRDDKNYVVKRWSILKYNTINRRDATTPFDS